MPKAKVCVYHQLWVAAGELVVRTPGLTCAGALQMVRSADPDMRWQATEILDTAKSMGLKVLRIWAFSDGPLQYNALQRYPGAAPQAGPFLALGYFTRG